LLVRLTDAAVEGKLEAYFFSPARPKRAKTRSFPSGTLSL
jgi:hypothetical protein